MASDPGILASGKAADGATLSSVIVVINARAGEVLQTGAERFANDVRDHFAEEGVDAEVVTASGKDISTAVERATRTRPDVPLIVAGGDGTLSRGLPLLVDRTAPSGILPLGTLNLLASDLGLAGTVRENITRLARARIISVDLATLNGVPFHSNVGLGFLSRIARDREQSRRKYPFSKTFGFAVAAVRALVATRPIHVEVEVNGQRASEIADAVLVTNNHFGGSPWHRARIDEGLLEVHLLRSGGLAQRIATVFAIWRGTWRELDTLRSFTATEVTIRRKGKRRLTVAADGELFVTSNPINVRILPRRLSLLAAPQYETTE